MKAAHMNRRQISSRVFVYVLECAAGAALAAVILASRAGAA
jgi:predicted nicotinamide N-methyase